MQSFRTELENPIVEKDIIELEKKIALFKDGAIDEERFRSLRLARGIYGQRQIGVQMIRIKLPYGFLNAQKIRRICDVSEEYSTGRLHITTRQDIQIHHVDLGRTPELWTQLEEDDITIREACGNTVRNITASATSGIDPQEAFDPRPYAHALFEYFLRNPICQEMGRKFKISFSNTEADSGLAFMHDIGVIAAVQKIDGKEVHGFKVWIGGGLGSQSSHAHLYKDFLPADQLIPLTEAVLRVFDRNGERSRRMKARLKFLIKDWGFEKFLDEVHQELKALPTTHPIAYHTPSAKLPTEYPDLELSVDNQDAYDLWKRTNVSLQKDGLYYIGVKVRLGDIFIDQARQLANWIEQYGGNEITLTINQDLIIRHVEEKTLATWYSKLSSIGLADIGYDKFNDLTACPGTDTCNLGIASSTGLSNILEKIISEEYPDLAHRGDLNIKMSGCMNACGQHTISTLGFQGMSMKAKNKRVLPATQILIGGGVLGAGQGRFADKVIKMPSKRVPAALRALLDDFKNNNSKNQAFLDYYDAQGKTYFYDLLKDFASIEDLVDDDFIDWGHSIPYIKAIGVGECAGVVIDLISTLFFESEEKLSLATQNLEMDKWQDSIYHSYTSIVNTAKALLIANDHTTNSHTQIINNFDEHFVDTNKITLPSSFNEFVLQLKNSKATKKLAEKYIADATSFYHQADQFRKKELES